MRNYRKTRKTRKHGGLRFEVNVFKCKTNTTNKKKISVYEIVEKCAQEFALAHNFDIINTADDGNCFYDSLSKYGKLTGNSSTNKTHLQLRKEIVGDMIKNMDEYSVYFIPDDPSANIPTNDEIKNDLKKYLKSRQWDGALGDIFPQVAAKVLNKNIRIFDVQNDGSVNMIEMGTGPEGTINTALPVIILIRTNGNHFRLLMPKVKNTVNNLTSAFKNATIVAGPNKESSIRRSVRHKTVKKAPSTKNNAAAGPGREASDRNRTSSLEKDLMKIAIQESEEQIKKNKKKQKKLNNNFFNALKFAEFNE